MARTQSENVFGLYPEETDLDGNLMPWAWNDDGNVLPVPETANFGPPSPMVKEPYYYEGFGAPPMLQIPAPLDRDLLSPLEDSLSPAVESPTYVETKVRRLQVLTVAQAKNRKAQKKFREKQKAKMVSLAEEVEMLRDRVQNLSMQNKELENSNVLLRKVVKMRDTQMITIKHTNERLLSQKESVGGKPKVVTCNKGDFQYMGRMPLGDDFEFGSFDCLKSSEEGNHHSMRQFWKKCVDVLSGLLNENDLQPNDSAITNQIHNVVSELGERCMKYVAQCPLGICKLVSNLDLTPHLDCGDEETIAFWKKVYQSLELTIQQEQQILGLRHRFIQQSESIWKERTRLSDQIKIVVEDRRSVLRSNSMSCQLGRDIREAIENLEETTSTDAQHHSDFIASFFRIVLKDVQIARVFVESYPYYPDVLFLANLVNEKHQKMTSKNKSTSFDSHSPGTVSLQSSIN